jgi:hypothetical protein
MQFFALDFSSSSSSSDITLRNLPRLILLLYAARQALHQLSKPFFLRLCGGKNSDVDGLFSRHLEHVSNSMPSTTTLFALVAPFRPSSLRAFRTFWRKKTFAVPHPWVFWDLALEP